LRARRRLFNDVGLEPTLVTFHVALAFVIVSTLAAFCIGWCIPIGEFVSEHAAPAIGVLGSSAWSRRASWFLLLFAGLAAQAIVAAAAAYRLDIDDLISGFGRSPIVFSIGWVAVALSLLTLWGGVPLRALLRRKHE
jgi:hypothetical protein